MYRIRELEDQLKCKYPDMISPQTQMKREENIRALQEMIRSSIASNCLEYGTREERVQIYETLEGEKIYIQYPGKESAESGDKKRPYDFRPKIILSDGRKVPDLQFESIWGIIENLNHQQHKILKLMSCIFFRMSRMLDHTVADDIYPCEILNPNNKVIDRAERHLRWNKFVFAPEIMESLNFHCDHLRVTDDISISMEALLYFFELLMNNEDSKYYYAKNKLTSARIHTGDSMLLLSSSLHGNIRLSTLLQKFVSGFGVAHCSIDEIEPATDHLVHIVDLKSEIAILLDKYNIDYKKSSSITIDKKTYSTAFRIPGPRIAILNKDNNGAICALSNAGWTVHILNDLLDESYLASFEESLVAQNETPETV